ncbi:MAG: hypothetical protein ACLR0N_16590 [Bilophila wadsworthia]
MSVQAVCSTCCAISCWTWIWRSCPPRSAVALLSHRLMVMYRGRS